MTDSHCHIAGEDRARLCFAGIDFQFQQTLRLRHLLGFEHLRCFQLDLGEIVDGD